MRRHLALNFTFKRLITCTETEQEGEGGGPATEHVYLMYETHNIFLHTLTALYA